MEGKLRQYWPLPLRVFIGIAFMIHGAPKLFSGAEHAGFVGMLHQLGVPAASFMAWVVGVVEFFGGIALVLGLFTAEAAVLLGIEMLVAMLAVHAGHGFQFVHVAGTTAEGAPIFGLPGVEVNLLYISALLALLIGGPGPLSMDERIFVPESRLRPPWLRRRALQA